MQRRNLGINLRKNVIIVGETTIQTLQNILDGRKNVLQRMSHANIAEKGDMLLVCLLANQLKESIGSKLKDSIVHNQQISLNWMQEAQFFLS